jgi:phosphoribosylformimino-5-aminoimidazole carboxamide ribotide isomerase
VELIPALDLLGGKVVRLHRGRYEDVTVYADDPLPLAERFFAAGAKRLHVVDLEGARSGTPAHESQIARIVSKTSLQVQIGGGIRDRDTAERWLRAGAARVVLGTSAIRDPDLVHALCEAHPGRVVVALDARGDDVAIEGWTQSTGKPLASMAAQAQAWGAAAILYTDIDRDGTGEGPAIDRTAALQRGLAIDVIASGGIGTQEHLRELARAEIRACVCGRALVSGAIAIEDALRAAEDG